MEDLQKAQKFTGLSWGGSGDPDAPSTGPPQGASGMHERGSSPEYPDAIPVPDSPTLSVQLPPSPTLSVQLPAPVSCFGKNCTFSQSPVADRGRNDKLPRDQLRALYRQKGYCRKDSKAAPKTLLASMDAGASKPTRYLGDRCRKRGLPPAEVAEFLNGSHGTQEKRCRVDAPLLALVADKEVAGGRAQ